MLEKIDFEDRKIMIFRKSRLKIMRAIEFLMGIDLCPLITLAMINIFLWGKKHLVDLTLLFKIGLAKIPWLVIWRPLLAPLSILTPVLTVHMRTSCSDHGTKIYDQCHNSRNFKTLLSPAKWLDCAISQPDHSPDERLSVCVSWDAEWLFKSPS